MNGIATQMLGGLIGVLLGVVLFCRRHCEICGGSFWPWQSRVDFLSGSEHRKCFRRVAKVIP